ncbi:hypothetical protein [Pseudomonas cremoricolorata]|uniref:hypothetical protein n=1 Tax=Pseudomonas cremoricolorata TaxID=157783 RepID=UPI000676A12E|nr:hypothetical protein [Pseudomonas cremoricolorata]
MAVRKAVDQTPYGERFNEWVEKLNEKLGKRLADYIENKDLDKDLEFDNELIGGGKFMTSVLTGALPGRKGSGERRAVSVESGHKGAGQGGSEKGTGAESAKGSAAVTAEANNALSAAKGVVASRANVRTGAANVTGSGLEYAWKKHGGAWGDNKSAFTISKDELKVVLQSPQVVKTPAYQSPTSGNFI